MEFETITNELYKSGELKLLSSVSPNWKHGQTNKLMKGTYANEYNSQKYSDRSTLRSLAMNFNSYLVFEYLRYQDTNRISESIYCSYPHLADLQAFFINAVNFINENYDAIYVQNGINPDFSQPLISEKFTQGKSLAIQPAKVSFLQNNMQVQVNGVLFMIGSDSYTVEMTIDNFFGLAGRVIDMTNSTTFHTEQRMNYMMGYLHSIEEKLEGNNGSLYTPANNPRSNTGFGNNATSFSGQGSSFNSSQAKQPGQKIVRKNGFSNNKANVPSQTSFGNQQTTSGFGGSNTTPTINKNQTVNVEKTTFEDLSNDINPDINNDMNDPFERNDQQESNAFGNVDTTNSLSQSMLSEIDNVNFDISDSDEDFEF